MQISDWGNVLIRHVREWKHRKHSLWASPFSGVEFHGAFHFQKIIFLRLLQIWSSYCFHCSTAQLWMHTQSNNKTKCLKRILLTVKHRTPHLRTFWHEVIYNFIWYITVCWCCACDCALAEIWPTCHLCTVLISAYRWKLSDFYDSHHLFGNSQFGRNSIYLPFCSACCLHFQPRKVQ